MNKAFATLAITLLLIGLALVALPARGDTSEMIVVGSADTVRQTTMDPTTALSSALSAVLPRLQVSYANTLRQFGLNPPPGPFFTMLTVVQNRILMAFANTNREIELIYPAALLGEPHTDIVAYALGGNPDALWFATGNSQTPFFAKKYGFNDNGVYDQLVAGDFNGDGMTDVVAYARGSSLDAIWLATGNSQPPYFGKNNGFNDNGVYYQLVAGDFDGDGLTDIIAYARGSKPDSLWFSTGNNKPPFFAKNYGFNDNSLYDQLVAGDFNGDGLTDIVAYSRGSGPDALWFSTGNNKPPFFAKNYGFNDNGVYDQLIAGDFSGDGLTDIIAYARGNKPDALWFATGNNQPPFFAKNYGFNDNGEYEQLVAGDFNGDGLTDIVAYGRGSSPDAIWFATGNSQTPFFAKNYGFNESRNYDWLIAGYFDRN